MPGLSVYPVMLQRLIGEWGSDAHEWLHHQLPKLIGILVVAFILTRLLKLVTSRLERFSRRVPERTAIRSQQLRTLASVIQSVGTFVILFLAALQILPLFDVDAKPILASAGIVGLAVGFGAQTLVKDVINGFFILFENQYDLGDVVKLSGVSGTVEMMSLRRTTLRDANGTVHTIPNSEIHVVSNLTRDWAQVSLSVAVDYNESSDRIVGLLKEVGDEIHNDPAFTDDIVAAVEVPGIERVAGQEVDYLVLAKVRPGQQYRISRELRRRIKDCFSRNNIKPGGPSHVYIVGTPESSLAGEKK
jgi:small-conductance mechanosensitive channel